MIDLHTHSTFSDGSYSPEALVRAAARAGLAAVALTDHDTMDGLARCQAAAAGGPVRAVPGVEISADCQPADATMHVLGYFVDPSDAALAGHIVRLRDGRRRRNEEIVKRLNGMGLALTLAEVMALAGEGNAGRLHFALALVARGYVRTTQEAFDRFLAKGKAAYADRLRFAPADGVAMIRRAGGIAVLAHPFTLKMGREALAGCVEELVGAGLQGIEVYYPQHAPAQVKQYLGLVRRFGLVATGGTDFHGAPMPDIQLGRGRGDLEVPDTVLAELEALRAR